MTTTNNLRCVLPTTDVLGETPLWCEATQSLLWLDIDAGRLQRFHPASGRHDVFTFDVHYVGTLALMHAPGQVLLGMDLGLHVFDMATGSLRMLCQVEPAEKDGRPNENRLNDGRCDARGRFWVGTMDNQLSRPNGSFYRVETDGSVQKQFGDVIVSNTVTMSPAQDTLYFSDTRRFTTWKFELDVEAGTIADRRVFADHTATRSRPDGACVDSEGFVWTAMFGNAKLMRLAPDGRVDREVELPVRNPTCVCLGGPDLKTLYITSARKFLDRKQLREQPWSGALLAMEVDVAGLPEKRFGKP
jgi:sugar lactone lactonase YvrE